ncbi:TPA: hypothetical protein HA278_02265 [Candidatus Woesearchaeota archaeon]|nr:hypothetical protein [Candidatus Woesearchaeota archaeon]|tara:strand:- start:582 stop:833 length:252 start_codon:yes stop_codon:yes gene_type:complete
MSQLPKELETVMCLYCDNSLEKQDWQSVWVGEMHYKVNQCSCHKKVWVKVDFAGSGHDNFTQESELESVVRQVAGFSDTNKLG